MAQSTTLYRGTSSLSNNLYWPEASLFTLGASAPAKIIISRLLFYTEGGNELFYFSGGQILLYINSSNGNQFPIVSAGVPSNSSNYRVCSLIPSEQNNGMQSTVYVGGTLNTTSGLAVSTATGTYWDNNSVLTNQSVLNSSGATNTVIPKIFWMGPSDSLRAVLYAGRGDSGQLYCSYVFTAISET